MKTYQVRIYDIRKLNDGRPRPWRVRWVVDGKEHIEPFATKALADSFRADLLKATNQGQPFDTGTGLPASIAHTRNATTCYQLMRRYLAAKWPRLAAKSRRSTVESLTAITPYLVRLTTSAPDPALLREALYTSAFNPARKPHQWPEEHESALAWLDKHSLPVAELDSLDHVRRVLDQLALRLDGKPAAATTLRRRRSVLYNALRYAIELGLLASNPLDRIQWTAPATAQAVDRRVVANPTQIAHILNTLAGMGNRADKFVAFFGCLYYAGTRPSEAANLKLGDCQLPGHCPDCGTTLDNLLEPAPTAGCGHEKAEPGWGRIILAETSPYAGTRFTDDGKAYQHRGLKHRPRSHTRPVPIPPRLVALLADHVHRHGVAPDGRMFPGYHGGPLSPSGYERWWRLARERAFTPEQAASPLVRRPYDLRHAAASLWLSAGLPATEVARRLGQGVAVLLRVYANCIDGTDHDNNQRIGAALG
jgi:integrase